MMNEQSKHPVTLEDLLRLKRVERPPVEFWSDFDRELREKQLAALVAKRPWWRGLPRALRGIARYPLPLGATAVLAVTLLSIRDYRPAAPVANGGNISEIEAMPREVAPASSEPVADAPVAPVAQSDLPAPAPVVATASAATTVSPDANMPGELARMVPMLSPGDPDSHVDILPSARSIAENRAVAEAMLGTTSSGFENRALPVRVTPPEPLAQISNPSEVRRSRFATVFATAAMITPSAPTTRVARRLSDEQLYDTIHRYSASGNSVSFRF